MKFLTAVIVAGLAVMLAYQIAMFFWLARYDPIGDCVDAGGCWDAVNAVCRDGAPDGAAQCDAPGKSPGAADAAGATRLARACF